MSQLLRFSVNGLFNSFEVEIYEELKVIKDLPHFAFLTKSINLISPKSS